MEKSMTDTWNEARLLQYIADGIEESLNLDYKAADALSKSDGKKKEITKDVSAMSNSDGGLIIYGIAEFQDEARKHLPEKIDPVSRNDFSKEWLEQVINNIRPKIDGLKIYPINLSSGANDVAYVVDIPQSHTVHQATDKKYYKRFNFLSEPMEDYEIRDVMNRGQYPEIHIDFSLSIRERPSIAGLTPDEQNSIQDEYTLRIGIQNVGNRTAKNFVIFLMIPTIAYKYPPRNTPTVDILGDKYYQHQITNLDNGHPLLPKLGKHWNFPIHKWSNDTEHIGNIYWEAYADDASPSKGQIPAENIEIIRN
jgi:hypothetical protein